MPLRDPESSTLQGSSADPSAGPPGAPVPMVPVLALLWSKEEPARVGELVCLPRSVTDASFTIGRALEPGEDMALPLTLQQLRPFSRTNTGPLRAGMVSRWQLRVRALAGGDLRIEQIGRGEMRVNGEPTGCAVVTQGDVIEACGRFALLYTRRPADWPREAAWGQPFAFGTADACGIVGESPAAWQLRRQIALVATRDEHVLVHGPSGAGKELVVRGLHRLSPRAAAPLVARNAVTIPESLIDAELFGNLPNYPSPGVPDRPGLLGEVDGGTLLLDEIGELPHALQAHLLRVMDNGEYQRLGEACRRTVDFRLLGATNRALPELKHDLLARFIHRLRVPGLDERPEDLPLLARHILRQLGERSPELRPMFFDGDEPRLGSDLVLALVRRHYTAHVRELLEVLWQAVTDSPGSVLVAPHPPAPPAPSAAPDRPPRGAPEALQDVPGREQVVAALAAVDGVRELAWRHLGLDSRHQLKRLIKKYDIK